MRTFYIIQGGALEDYLKQSNGNGNGNGNGIGIDGPGHPGCQGICNGSAPSSLKETCGCAYEPSASIDSGIGISIVLGVVLGIMILLKLKN
jgi:hypothetical protein